MNTITRLLSSREKALKLNLQPTIYGVFAEIGAGQDTSNHFYKAGAASGTIAKSICAYDMMVSDSIYGKTKRYVSKERLKNMLDTEYEGLIASVPVKAETSHFFAFANTVETINYHKTNKGQGWLGVKFQLSPNSRPSSCMLHVILHTNNIDLQQEIIGDLGVNLIHGVYENFKDPEDFIESLRDNINPKLVEINFIEVDGEFSKKNSSKALSLILVKRDFTRMVMFGSDGSILQPINALYKKDALIIRGRFNPPTNVTVEMFEKSKIQLIEKHGRKKQDVLAIAEITFNCFEQQEALGLEDFLTRTSYLSAMGHPVMVTNFQYHHELIGFLNEFCKLNSLNLALGLDNLQRAFNPGEGFENEPKIVQLIHALVSGNNHILAFPEYAIGEGLKGVNHLKLPDSIRALISFLQNTKRIEDIENIDLALLKFRSDEIRSIIESNSDDWMTLVPESIHKNIVFTKKEKVVTT